MVPADDAAVSSTAAARFSEHGKALDHRLYSLCPLWWHARQVQHAVTESETRYEHDVAFRIGTLSVPAELYRRTHQPRGCFL